MFTSELMEVKQTACENFRLFLIAPITTDNWVSDHTGYSRNKHTFALALPPISNIYFPSLTIEKIPDTYRGKFSSSILKLINNNS